MFSHIWKKYLPIIKILLKKSKSGDQVLTLNRTDFEKGGTGRKAGYKFTIEFDHGRVGNVISGSPLAVSLSADMMDDEPIKEILDESIFEVSLSTKFLLTIKHLEKKPE